MYEAFFGLRQRPFQPMPRVDAFVPVAPLREPIETLTRCIEQNQGIGVLTAPPGAGKSLICRRLQRQFHESMRTVYLSTGGFPTRRALLQAILFEMKLPYVGLSEQETRLSLMELLQVAPAPMNRLLLIVDEAHLLNTRGLEELRILTDWEIDGQSRISLILSGQLELEEMLTEPSMNALNQRVGCHVCIEPLTHEESALYIRERLRLAGNDGLSLFTPEAIDWICTASEGNPRRINQLCDHCLLLAFAEEERQVGPSIVRAALLDLRELPLHWNTPVNLDSAHSSDDRNPLEAYAEAQTAATMNELDDADFDDEPDTAVQAPWSGILREDTLDRPSELEQSEYCSSEVEVGVFEVGADWPVPSEPSAPHSSLTNVTELDSLIGDHPAERLFHSPEFIIPDEIQRMAEQDALSPVVSAPEDTMAASSIPAPEVIAPPARPAFEELVVNDPYALIDRQAEALAPRLTITRPTIRQDRPAVEQGSPEPQPEVATPESIVEEVVAYAAPPHEVIADSTPEPTTCASSGDTLEFEILDMVQEIRGEVRRAQARSEQNFDFESAPLSEPAPQGRSLRQSIAWQFDVVEPEAAAETAEETPPATLPWNDGQATAPSSAVEPLPSAVEPVEVSDELENATDLGEPERRYAQLFTRLQRQRRRVEAVMNRERRGSPPMESRTH